MGSIRRTFLAATVAALASALTASATSMAAEVTVITPPKDAVPESYFGMHIHRAVPTKRFPQPAVWPTVPFKGWRLHDSQVQWPHVEPKPGVFDFSVLDRVVALARERGKELLMPLALTPTWASARPTEASAYGTPGWAAEPKSMLVWENYVRTVATRYKGAIRHYEIWNEPNAKDFFSGTPEQMVELARSAYKILKEIDPSIQVVSPAATGGSGPAWLDRYLKAGGGEFADVIGFHFYVSPRPPEQMLSQVERVRDVMARHGVAGKPLWNTETGWLLQNRGKPITPDSRPDHFRGKILDVDEAGPYVARALVLGWAMGIRRFYWYSWDNIELGFTEPDGQEIKPVSRAYGNVAKWMTGAQFEQCRGEARGVWMCRIKLANGDDGTLAWSSARSETFDLGASWKLSTIHDIDGGSRKADGNSIALSHAPILIQTQRR